MGIKAHSWENSAFYGENTTAVVGQAAKTTLYLAWTKKNKSNVQHTHHFLTLIPHFYLTNIRLQINIYIPTPLKRVPHVKNQVHHCVHIIWLIWFLKSFFKPKLHLWTSHNICTPLVATETWVSVSSQVFGNEVVCLLLTEGVFCKYIYCHEDKWFFVDSHTTV